MSRILCLTACGLLAAACGDDGTSSPDTGMATDTGTKVDAGSDAGADAGFTDQGTPDGGDEDMGTDDAGTVTTPLLEPGVGASIPGLGRLEVRATAYAALADKGGTRASNGRSYVYERDGAEVEVWFANTNLDDDSASVDDTDLILWVRVAGSGSPKTADGIGPGSSRADVEAAYGAPERMTNLADGEEVAAYYTKGFLVSYDAQDRVEDMTVCRIYPSVPGGSFDPKTATLSFPGGASLKGTTGLANRGSAKGDIQIALGDPDGVGTVSLGNAELTTWSYGFIGIEIFFLGNSANALFLAVHAPYFGTATGGVGVGSSRADVESLLGTLGYPTTGTPASSTAGLLCYGQQPDIVGVTFDESDVATTFSFRLLTCP